MYRKWTVSVKHNRDGRQLKCPVNYGPLCMDHVQNILRLLDALKERGCIKDREYIDIKSQLERKIDLNLYESIDSTVDNMIKDINLKIHT